MVKHKTSPAFSLTLTLLLSQLPHVNSASATVTAKRKPSCLTCSVARDAHSSPGDLTTLGRRTQPLPLKPVQRSLFDVSRVNFVSAATGGLAFAVADLELGGALPILFQRVYDGARRDEDTGLGVGWSFVFDDLIRMDGDSATLTTGTGSRLAFRRADQSQHFTLRDDEPGAHQSFDLAGDGTINEQAAGLTRTYKKIGASYRLAQIADPNGNAVNIAFNSRGNAASITSGSATIALQWSDAKDSRLLSVSDSAGRRISFKQDGRRLRAVTDSAGAEWTYKYAADRLTEAADPLGRVLLRARYDKAGRAVEAGDAAGTYSFDYDSTDATVSPRTVVTDPVGAQTIFTHTSNGALSEASDEEGRLALIEYNASNRPARTIDATGNETRFSYDAQNRLLRQTASDGAEMTHVYDEQGHLISTTDGFERTDYVLDARGNTVSARNVDPAQSYDVTRDARGRATSITSKAGRTVKLEHDADGNETAIAYSDAGRFERNFDAAGRKVSERLPSGLTTRYKYDKRGGVSEQSDDNGRSLRVERDASGAVTGLITGGGSFVRAERDATGRIVALTNSAGKTRRFAYDARGSLTDYVDARGRSRKMRYDHYGRLQSVTDSDGVSSLYDYDRAGRLVAVRRADRKEANSFLSLPARYNPALPLPALAQGVDCFFGGDGFGGGGGGDMISIGSDPFDPKNCGDPFGGFGAGSGGGGGVLLGGGGFDSIDGESRGTCYDCQKRELDICRLQLEAELKTILAGSMGFDAGCLSLIALPSRYFTCLFTAASSNWLLNDAARAKAEACKLAMPSKCKAECPGLIFP
jgi:YD repeat-containing protein